MAKVVIYNPACTIGGQDYTAQMSNATLDLTAAELDTSNFDTDGWKAIITGEKSGTFSVEWKKDSDLSGLDLAMFTAFDDGTTLAVTLKRLDDTMSASNPEYQFNIVVTNWSPVAGSVNQLFGGSNTWPVTGAVVRDISP